MMSVSPKSHSRTVQPQQAQQAQRIKHDNFPWIVRFQPRHFNELVGHDTACHRLVSLSRHALAMPPLLVHGPIGCGKRSLLQCLFQHMKPSPSSYRIITAYDCLTDHRLVTSMHILQRDMEMKCSSSSSQPSFAVVVLEHVDTFAKAFQVAVSRLLQSFSFRHIKFFFTCTHLSNVVPCLRSRCADVSLTRLSFRHCNQIIDRICGITRMRLSSRARQHLSFLCHGDARVLVNQMQTLYDTSHADGKHVTNINVTTLEKLFDMPPPHVALEILACCAANNVVSAASLVRREFLQHGFSFSDVYNTLRVCIQEPSRLADMPLKQNANTLNMLSHMSEYKRSALLQTLMHAHHEALLGQASWIQCCGVLASITRSLLKFTK